MKEFLMDSTGSPRSFPKNEDLKTRALGLKVLHAMDRHFWNVFKYETYRAFNLHQSYDGNLVVKTGNYSK